MSERKKRTKTISFRVSEEELELIKKACMPGEKINPGARRLLIEWAKKMEGYALIKALVKDNAHPFQNNDDEDENAEDGDILYDEDDVNSTEDPYRELRDFLGEPIYEGARILYECPFYGHKEGEIVGLDDLCLMVLFDEETFQRKLDPVTWVTYLG